MQKEKKQEIIFDWLIYDIALQLANLISVLCIEIVALIPKGSSSLKECICAGTVMHR